MSGQRRETEAPMPRPLGPRIGRADVMAALRAGPDPIMAAPRRLPPTLIYSPDEVTARARAIADSLAGLTRLTGSVRRRDRGDAERRARLDGLHDRAIALWYELGRLANEASEHPATNRRLRREVAR